MIRYLVICGFACGIALADPPVSEPPPNSVDPKAAVAQLTSLMDVRNQADREVDDLNEKLGKKREELEKEEKLLESKFEKELKDAEDELKKAQAEAKKNPLSTGVLAAQLKVGAAKVAHAGQVKKIDGIKKEIEALERARESWRALRKDRNSAVSDYFEKQKGPLTRGLVRADIEKYIEQGKAGKDGGRQTDADEFFQSRERRTGVSADGKTQKVQSGDSLVELAQDIQRGVGKNDKQLWGEGGLVNKLYENLEGQGGPSGDPNLIFPGQTINLEETFGKPK